MATVYAVASAKGGVGKTTTTAAIATILADSGADVVAIDADIGMANLAGTLGVTPGETTLHDVLAERADPLDAVHDGPAGLRVVPGATALDAYAAANPSGLTAVVEAFEDADYVFIDAGAGLSHDSTLPLGLADETLLVSTPERSALGDTEKTRQLTERLGGSVAGAAITRVPDAAAGRDGASGTDDDDVVAELLDAAVLGRIPEDEAVLRAGEAAEPLALFAPDSPATRAYRDLTRALTGAEVDGAGPAAGASVAGDADDTDDTADAADADSKDAPETPGGEEPDGSPTEGAESDTPDEEIIVADSEQAGLGEPGDESEIIVADESSVPADGTEMVGEEHVDGDDLEAMVGADDERTAGFDDEGDDESAASDGANDDEIADADEVAAQADRSEPETVGGTESGDDGDANDTEDIDDELAGSVPFRDDDTGTMNTVLSESGGNEAEGPNETEETEEASGSDDATDTDETEETDDEKGGGFFSRLLGR